MQKSPYTSEVAAIVAKMRMGRGHGEDALPQEMYRMNPQFWARRLHPIIVKSMTRLEEPPSWKGGALAELYKGSGDRREPGNSRSVLISDACSKVYHAWLRARLMRRLMERVGDS